MALTAAPGLLPEAESFVSDEMRLIDGQWLPTASGRTFTRAIRQPARRPVPSPTATFRTSIGRYELLGEPSMTPTGGGWLRRIASNCCGGSATSSGKERSSSLRSRTTRHSRPP